MKAAVVYYSMLGNSELVAQSIAGKIDADIIRIEPDKAYPDKGAKKFLWGGMKAVMGEMPVLKPYQFDADKYDTVIIGFPVWASRPAPPIMTFLNDEKDKLKGKKIAVYACQSGNGAEKAFEKIKSVTGSEDFKAELILIDPKTKVNAENETKIREFCKKLEA
jgi:flavodoxin